MFSLHSLDQFSITSKNFEKLCLIEFVYSLVVLYIFQNTTYTEMHEECVNSYKVSKVINYANKSLEANIHYRNLVIKF